MNKFVWAICLLISDFGLAEQVESWSTNEGALVYFYPNSNLPILDVQLTFDAAASRDGIKPGVANLTNRLLGTSIEGRNEGEILDDLDRLGAIIDQGSLRDMAYFSIRTLSTPQVAEPVLALFVKFLRDPKFDKVIFNRERNRLKESIIRAEQSPARTLENFFYQTIFGHHPYGRPMRGSVESVDKISLVDVKNHYQQYYVAKNMVISLVGDVTLENAKKIANALSASLPVGQRPSVQSPAILMAGVCQHIDFPSTQTHLSIGQVGVNYKHPDYAALVIGNQILGGAGSLNSLLGSEIREKRGLAYSVSSALTAMGLNGFFRINLQTKNDQSDLAHELAITTLEDFLSRPPEAETLAHTKANVLNSLARRTTSNKGILAQLAKIGFYNLPIDYFETLEAEIKQLTPEDVHQAMTRFIDLENLSVITVGGVDKAQTFTH